MKSVLSTILKSISPSILFCSILVAAAICSRQAVAQGNLLVTPQRVVFEGSKRMEELNLANTGKDTAKYLISFIEIRMNKDGTFEKITQPDSGQNFASGNVRFFPRKVVLGPGEAQTIKMQLSRQSQLLPGEYRSHLYFRAMPDEKPLGDQDITPGKTGISVQLKPVFGISIPVIIRVGESATVADVSNPSFAITDGVPTLSMVLNRTGNMSVYGDIRIDFISPQGKTIKAGEIKGIAVYTPTASRMVRVNLDNTAGINYKTGKLHITYTTSPGTKSAKTLEKELELL